jgi:hypothetical protein
MCVCDALELCCWPKPKNWKNGYLIKTAKNIRREGVWDKIKREENKKILTPEST